MKRTLKTSGHQGRPSAIDHVYTTPDLQLVNAKTIPNGMSGHDPIVAIVDGYRGDAKRDHILWKRNMKNYSAAELSLRLSGLDWNSLINNDMDCDGLADAFSKNMRYILDELAPITKYKILSQ